MQDDWHVRIFSESGQPLNITELRAGSRVKAYLSTVGRHVGVQVREYIKEI